MLCESTIRGGSLSPGGAWRRLQSPRNENSRLTTSKPPGAQDPVQGPLHRWHRDLQPLEAAQRGQGLELQQPLGEALPNEGLGHEHHLTAVSLHGPAALLGVELIVHQHHCRQVVRSWRRASWVISPCTRAWAPKRGGLAGMWETKRILRRSGLIEPIWAARHAAYVGGAAPGGYRVHSSESWLSSSEGQFL